MKAVMISNKPKDCELIANGKKTVLVRKTRPKIDTPFKCHIYCTGGRVLVDNESMIYSQSIPKLIKRKVCKGWFKDKPEETTQILTDYEGDFPIYNGDYELNGKVIGEFICNKIEVLDYLTQIPDLSLQNGHFELAGYTDVEPFYGGKVATIRSTLLSNRELVDYGKGKPLYAWHISKLKIYNKPKELMEFVVEGECNEEERCGGCKFFHYGRGWLDGSYCDEDDCEIDRGYKPLMQAPRSWQYCEELEEE